MGKYGVHKSRRAMEAHERRLDRQYRLQRDLRARGVRPLKGKTEWLVITSFDKTAWVVCGWHCAARVLKSKAPTKQRAIDYALKHPNIWTV